MPSRCITLDRPARRHDLVVVRAQAWNEQVAMRADLVSMPHVARWADNNWPLMRRRLLPGEVFGLPLGLPLPPLAGKQRLSFSMQYVDVLSVDTPPALSAVIRLAPRTWMRTLVRLNRLAACHSVVAQVFGSLAWQTVTGLEYLTAHSDLDLLLNVQHGTDLERLVEGLAKIEANAPMRIDGELVRDDGVAVNWREVHAGAHELLAKTLQGATLLQAQSFLPEAKP